MRLPKSWGTWVLLGAASACALALMAGAMSLRPSASPEQVASRSGGAFFTPGHSTLAASFRDFLGTHEKEPVQPIAYTHKAHLEKGLNCEFCHAAVTKGPQASIPNARFCMSCHIAIAADKPEIKKLAAYVDRGEDVVWKRVYDYPAESHVRFNHAPHIRAGVGCENCHGDMRQRTVAARTVNMNMGFCIGCHQERKASLECQTCHY